MNKRIFKTQEYEWKDGVSTRVIDETTLRIYFPWVPEADLAIPLIAASSEHSIETIVYFSRWSYHTLTFIYLRGLHDTTWLNFVKIVELPDKDAISISSKIVEGYESYPRGPESAGVGGILNICTCYFSSLCNSHVGFMIQFIITNALFVELIMWFLKSFSNDTILH